MRSRGAVFGGIAVLVAVLAVGAARILGARGYDDLQAGSFERVRGDRIDAGAPPSGAWRLRFHPGGAFTVGFGLRNDGHRSINVRDVGRARAFGMRRIAVRMATRVTPEPPRRIVPFRSFELPAGKERYVQVTMLMGRCNEQANVSLTLKALAVRYRVNFFERDKDVRLGMPVRLLGAGGPRCRRR
jgi:hypothetical protein